MIFGFGDGYAMADMTPVDNQFIREYLPMASGDYVRVYLYGLMCCHHPEAGKELEEMSRELDLPEEEILKAYRYWERRGLVRRISDRPPAWQYLPVRSREREAEGLRDPAYEAFAESLYGVFSNERRLHGSEIQTCYEWVTELKLPPEAVIMLLKHMETVKGKNFTIHSAEKMALKMAEEKIRTLEEAEEFLSRDEEIYNGTKAVLRRLGKRNAPSEDQLALYRKWTREWGFTREAVEDAPNDLSLILSGEQVTGFNRGGLKGEPLFRNCFVMRRDLLINILEWYAAVDYLDIFEALEDDLGKMDIRGYRFDGYIRSIATVRDYFQHSMELLRNEVREELFSRENPIMTKVQDSVPTKYLAGAVVKNALIPAGCVIQGTVENSILFRGVQVKPGAVVRNSILMQSCVVEPGAVVENAIIDRGNTIAAGTVLKGSPDNVFILNKHLI